LVVLPLAILFVIPGRALLGGVGLYQIQFAVAVASNATQASSVGSGSILDGKTSLAKHEPKATLRD
jgi:hypothetical protein